MKKLLAHVPVWYDTLGNIAGTHICHGSRCVNESNRSICLIVKHFIYKELYHIDIQI